VKALYNFKYTKIINSLIFHHVECTNNSEFIGKKILKLLLSISNCWSCIVFWDVPKLCAVSKFESY
jgi:hypothetical protein